MARLILGNVWLDIFYYEHTEDGLLIDREKEYYDESQMYHNFSDQSLFFVNYRQICKQTNYLFTEGLSYIFWAGIFDVYFC